MQLSGTVLVLHVKDLEFSLSTAKIIIINYKPPFVLNLFLSPSFTIHPLCDLEQVI